MIAYSVIIIDRPVVREILSNQSELRIQHLFGTYCIRKIWTVFKYHVLVQQEALVWLDVMAGFNTEWSTVLISVLIEFHRFNFCTKQQHQSAKYLRREIMRSHIRTDTLNKSDLRCWSNVIVLSYYNTYNTMWKFLFISTLRFTSLPDSYHKHIWFPLSANYHMEFEVWVQEEHKTCAEFISVQV